MIAFSTPTVTPSQGMHPHVQHIIAIQYRSFGIDNILETSLRYFMGKPNHK